ncbi:MAG: hypothetical protein GYB23_10805 [Vibrionaceae bacterium]|nr:hypothetical protein [Vibrionaceae bacterium]
MIRNLIWKIFPPYEVKVTLESVDALLNRFSNSCTPIISNEVKYLVKDAEKTVHSIRIEHIDPERLAFTLITNVIARNILSGSYHTYRGVLNSVGNDMKKLWLNLQDYMVSQGDIKFEEKEKDNDWLNEQIKMIG